TPLGPTHEPEEFAGVREKAFSGADSLRFTQCAGSGVGDLLRMDVHSCNQMSRCPQDASGASRARDTEHPTSWCESFEFDCGILKRAPEHKWRPSCSKTRPLPRRRNRFDFRSVAHTLAYLPRQPTPAAEM